MSTPYVSVCCNWLNHLPEEKECVHRDEGISDGLEREPTDCIIEVGGVLCKTSQERESKFALKIDPQSVHYHTGGR